MARWLAILAAVALILAGIFIYLRRQPQAPAAAVPSTPVPSAPVRAAHRGTATAGVFRPGEAGWYLRQANASGAPDAVVHFGAKGDVGLAGDWNGDGIDTIGVFRPSGAGWFLRNQNSAGAPDVPYFAYGAAGDAPVAGNWNGQ
jgi:hypothetical protein